MKRRDFLVGLSVSVSATALTGVAARSRGAWAGEAPHSPDWRTFEIITSVDVARPAGRTRLWLPVPLSHSTSYQRVLGPQGEAAGAARAELGTSPGEDGGRRRGEWADPKSVSHGTLINRVATCD